MGSDKEKLKIFLRTILRRKRKQNLSNLLEKMIELFKKFTVDLRLPQKVVDSLDKPRNNQELQIFALSLPDLEYPDTYMLAGRIYIYLKTLTSPKSVKDYIEILDGILRSEIKDFYKKHEKILNELLDSTYFHNFKFHNILSASSCTNYLLKISQHDPPVETPCQLMLRQAVQFYHDESIEKVVNCYHELIKQEYVHASPTMFNAGTKKNQMSSCFLLHLGDNLEDLLYTGIGDVGMISKHQGGIGLSMNEIRHSSISNTGKSSGVLPFARTYDSNIRCVDQGGKRHGAMTVSLNDWHIDAIDFIRSRDNYTHDGIRLKQANVALFVSSLFMKRVKKGENWTLFCPAKAHLGGERLVDKNGQDFEKLYEKLEKEIFVREKTFKEMDQKVQELEKKVNSDECTGQDLKNLHLLTRKRVSARKNLIDYKIVSAREFYETICDMNVKGTFPYMVYTDTVNGKNNTMNIGKTQSSNLCLEITLPATPNSVASCNLGHVNLKKFAKKEADGSYSYDFNHLGKATRSLVDNIDKVIQFNYYPLDVRDKEGKVLEKGKIHTPNIQNRPLGIGVSGLGDVFSLLKFPYDSLEAENLNKKIFACMYFNAMYRSMQLAKEKGSYETFRTGESKLFIDGEYKNIKGSPLSNGYFQFDLWKMEADYLESIGELEEEIYLRKDDEPVDPKDWDNHLDVKSWGELRELVKKHGVRNSMLIALMPTASSAQLLRNTETTEAHQTLMYSRKLIHGNYITFSEPFVEDMIRAGIWNKKMIDFINLCNGSIEKIHFFVSENPDYFPKEFFGEVDGQLKIKKEKLIEIMELRKIHRGMYEISQKVSARMARQRGIYVCQSQSLNAHFPEPNKGIMSAYHLFTNALRLKTGMYYLRANPASQTGKFTTSIDIQRYHKNMRKKKYICTEEECIMCQ